MSGLTFSLLPAAELVVARWPADTVLVNMPKGQFFSLTRTPDELSLVCEAQHLPAEPPAQSVESGWVALMLHGPFAFDQVGILAAFLEPLRGAGVGIFAISTFDTDYVLLKREQLAEALTALQEAGHQLSD